MQVWPEELEPLVRNLRMANTHVAVDLNTLCRGLCNVLDIPVYDDLIESLHWFFMLYLELKNNEQINPKRADLMGDSQVNFMSL
jgi:intraflagellar transport protein 46